jgi:hypothetical protein
MVASLGWICRGCRTQKCIEQQGIGCLLAFMVLSQGVESIGDTLEERRSLRHIEVIGG